MNIIDDLTYTHIDHRLSEIQAWMKSATDSEEISFAQEEMEDLLAEKQKLISREHERLSKNVVKLKLCNAVTLADQKAPLGITPSGAIIFEVTHVPEWISMQQVCREYQGFIGAWNGRKLSFEYAPPS